MMNLYVKCLKNGFDRSRLKSISKFDPEIHRNKIQAKQKVLDINFSMMNSEQFLKISGENRQTEKKTKKEMNEILIDRPLSNCSILIQLLPVLRFL